MPLQNINKLLDFQGINTKRISVPIKNTIYIQLEPSNSHQECPCCKSLHVIKKGILGNRKVRHLNIFNFITILLVPKIRLNCKTCDLNFSYEYSFVSPKSRYTNAFKSNVAKQLIGSTVSHISYISDTPYSSCERFIKTEIEEVTQTMQDEVLVQSQNTNRLVIGIDDFAIRKGHTYNTGIHDLKNSTLIHVSNGRRQEELLNDQELIQKFKTIKPHAVVMDLAKGYHNFAKTMFPTAIRIADRFHVNRYITDALHDLRRRLCREFPAMKAHMLKSSRKILGKRNDSLNVNEKLKLQKILNMNKELANAYKVKEKLIDWYDYALKSNAKHLFLKWIAESKQLNIKEITNALKTFENWSEEIINYHYCRFTNAQVEGRNNKIKTLQRKCYFLRNRKIYLSRIYLECNYLKMYSWQ